MVAKLASVVKIQSIHLVFKKIEERFTCNLIQFEKKAVAPKVIFFCHCFLHPRTVCIIKYGVMLKSRQKLWIRRIKLKTNLFHKNKNSFNSQNKNKNLFYRTLGVCTAQNNTVDICLKS